MQTAGYSGTPLVKKLGIKSRASLLLVQAPEHYLELVSPLPDHVEVTWLTAGNSWPDTTEASGVRYDFIHCFETKPDTMKSTWRWPGVLSQ